MTVHLSRYADGAWGLPDRAIPFSQSERRDAACPLRWWFRHAEGLSRPATDRQRYGTAWHACLEDVHRWWMALDEPYPAGAEQACAWCSVTDTTCSTCGGTQLGPLARAQRAWKADATKLAGIGDERGAAEALEEAECLARALDGWFRRYGRAPYRDYKVVAVEESFAAPILSPTGRPYAPETWVITDRDGRTRRCQTGEAKDPGGTPVGVEVKSVRWSWWNVGTLDCVLRHRRTGAVIVGEWKSTSAVDRLVDALRVDPQTATYALLLEHASAMGRFGVDHPPVRGFLYDVSSSAHQHDPEPLKQRKADDPLKLSIAKNRTVPSWRFRETCQRLGLDPTQYAEHMTWLSRSIDPKLYRREPGMLDEDGLRRVQIELYSSAVRHADFARRAALAADRDDVTAAFPRQPVCTAPGGSCSFAGPCVADGEDARRGYTVGDGDQPEPGAPGETTWQERSPW